MDIKDVYIGADRLLSADDISVLLKCAPDDARLLMKAMLIPSMKHGRYIKARLFAFNAFLSTLDGKDLREIISEARQALSHG